MTLHSIVGSSLCDLCGEKLMYEKVRDGEDTIARSPRGAFTSARRRTRSPEFRSVPLDAGAILHGASTVGDRGYKRTLTQPLESNFSTGATTRIMLYVIHV